jgi:translation elongation factor EF-G
MSNPLIAKWLDRKLSAGVARLPGICTVSHEFNRFLGPRSRFARVALSVEPADEFEYRSKVDWPFDNYDEWVIDGILDALIGAQHRPLIGATFTLIDVGYHPVDSSPIAFYLAAKSAVASLLATLERS